LPMPTGARRCLTGERHHSKAIRFMSSSQAQHHRHRTP
jgi:hypothetical protein